MPVDTGNLRNSITHMVNDGEKAAYIGTNSEYAVYVEWRHGRLAIRAADKRRGCTKTQKEIGI